MSDTISVSTIGFTKTTAQNFFERLASAGVRTVVDVRLNNTSQLSGFAKSNDLAYFLKQIGGIRYTHQPALAPSEGMLKAYKKDGGDWSNYEREFLALMEARRIEQKYKPTDFDQACLLCSEDKPHQCHRRLVCQYLNYKWGGTLQVRHL